MAELLKNRYSKNYIQNLAALLTQYYPEFDSEGYLTTVFADSWAELELKQRMRRLSSTLNQFLPFNYPQQISILKKVAPHLGGFEAMLFPDFVELFGMSNFKTSIQALEFFTQYSSSEFAVRPFILRYPLQMMNQCKKWAAHPNQHVRRLASEGCRPRLPWAIALTEFKKDPSPILPILEKLKADPSEYVRRSVANNLNDIAKDHPKLVLNLAQKWLGKTTVTDALIKHACRTLLKRGDKQALKLFGYTKNIPQVVNNFKISPGKLNIGNNLNFEFSLNHHQKHPLKLRVESAINFLKANGSISPKVFKITECSLPPKTPRQIKRQHPFRNFTTRKHHPGPHGITILINGTAQAKAKVLLKE